MAQINPEIHFDKKFYLASNFDLTSSIDLFEHYKTYGWREGRDPSPLFDSSFYKTLYTDFDASTVEPLRHYNSIGRFEGRHSKRLNSSTFDDSTTKIHAKSAHDVAIHCRITDLSLWPEICDLLGMIHDDYPVILSVDTTSDFDGAIRYAEKFDHLIGRTSFVIVPRSANDIDALVQIAESRLDQTKMWVNLVTDWEANPTVRAHQISQTIGSREQISGYIGRLSAPHPPGLCFAEQFRAFKQQARYRLEIRQPNADMNKEYPADSILWARSELLVAASDDLRALNSKKGSHNRREEQLRVLCEVADEEGYGFECIRSGIACKALIANPASSATGNADQRGNRWQAFSPSITGSRPLPLVEPFGPMNSRRIDLHWVIPDYSQGGGGHMTIFRFVSLLDKTQFRQTIWIQNCLNHATAAEAKQRIQQWYQPISDNVVVRFLPDDVESISGDAIIATDCWTAFPVSRMTRFKERFYFIQDWETEFHPAGDLRLAASLTHQMGFIALTAGTWLAQKASSAGMEVVSWTLGADTINYHPKERTEISSDAFCPSDRSSVPNTYRAWKVASNGPQGDITPQITFEYRMNSCPFLPESEKMRIPHIALYARGFTPRRAVDLALEGLKALAARGWVFHVHLYGEDKDFGELPFLYTPHGLTSPEELGKIYRKTDIGMAFSATNYSLVPLEMMVSNVPVLEIDTESTRAAYPDDAVLRATPAAYAIADALETLLKEPKLRQSLIEGGRRFVQKSDWAESVKTVGEAIISRILAKGSVDVAENIYKLVLRSREPVLAAPAIFEKPAASIFIPTFNAGNDFDVVLQAIAEQKFDAPFELVVIDSGSSDETLDLIRRWSAKIRINSLSIPNAAFGHGRTRNRGIQEAKGEYVAIITQDACPASPHWLQELVNGFGAGDRVAGVFGRHIAYPIHDLFEGQRLRDFFEKFRLLGEIYSIDDDLPSYVHRGSPDWQSTLQFYSDNNSCIRRSVWDLVPYKDVTWGEDQVWSWEVMRLGFQKAYAHEAAVYHSHDYPSRKLLQVGNEEGRMFLQHFGMYIGIDGNDEKAINSILSMVRSSVAADRSTLESRETKDEQLLLRRALQHLALYLGRSEGVTETKKALRKL
ncbi:MAG: glycosyltransferase [Drouetiella hepatica Uher 2000/2452]|jgi:glycosyltransferase involved in cell wall biosynthesis|uniref:Glycosyltransferase n=1 Tax=Drouetiella hepatica Uher 2000/2452 TaxID=904376 RepID=A0A951QGZ8_9CYAN|nr:glycosyltransferase [Drouetiella hepatica Uher 2000/2452]